MSGALFDYVEARLDVMNGARSDLLMVRESAPPPTTPASRKKAILQDRHIKKPPKFPERIHDGFGWLEEYVDVKMKEREASIMSASTASFDDDSVDVEVSSPRAARGHHHRRSLSRRDSLCLDLQESMDDKKHRRTHSRRESLLDGLNFLDLDFIDSSMNAESA